MIHDPYTLFGSIPLFRDPQGRYATDPLWRKDLLLHLDYIQDFRICCPVVAVDKAAPGLVSVEGLNDRNVIALRRDGGWGSVARNLVPNALRVRKALAATRIAHSSGAGWAFPLSYYLWLFRPFMRFKWVIVIESSFFRKPADASFSLRRSLSHHLNMFLLRRSVRAADARIFTSRHYQEMFLGDDRSSLIAPAIWINRNDIRSAAEHVARAPQGRTRARLLFPARLIPDKGVQTVLDAIGLLAVRARQGTPVPRIDIIGEGPMAEDCRRFAAAHSADLVRFHDPVDYGAPFFAFLRDYDAILVANLQEEQPRIIYDAFSQGLPCLCSETGGTRDLIRPGQTGLFFPAGDAALLANRLSDLAESAGQLHQMGGHALAQMTDATHENMHRVREAFLKQTLALD